MTARAARSVAAFTPSSRAVTVKRLEDRTTIRERLNANAPYAAFALAYLEARRFSMADFYEVQHNGRQAHLFHGRGAPGNTIQLFGDARLLAPVIALHPGARSALLTCEPEHVDTALKTYHLWHPQTMLRLELEGESFKPPAPPANVRRLLAADAVELNRLYALEGDGIWYSGRQVAEGVYFGAMHRGRVIAAAGTHIHSTTEGVGVVGNVFTHPDFRGHGLASAVVGAVTSTLLERCNLIVLSVDPANRTARHVYERLGYREAGRLVEAMATRRGAFSPVALFRRWLSSRRNGAGTWVVNL